MTKITDQQKKRYVIQQHFLPDGTFHFDLMFEEENVLKTYQLKDIQKLINGEKILGKNIQDHRIIYLDYEGEISGNRGYVKIFDKGFYITNKKDSNLIEFVVESSQFNGEIKINFLDIEKQIVEIRYTKFKEIL